MRNVLIFLLIVLSTGFFSCKSNSFANRRYRPGKYKENISVNRQIGIGHKKDTQSIFEGKNASFSTKDSLTKERKVLDLQEHQSIPLLKDKKNDFGEKLDTISDLETQKKIDRKKTRRFSIATWTTVCASAIIAEFSIVIGMLLLALISLFLIIIGIKLQLNISKHPYNTVKPEIKIILCVVLLIANFFQLLIMAVLIGIYF